MTDIVEIQMAWLAAEERARNAEAEVALLRSAGSRLLDALEGVAWQSCTEEWMLAHGMLVDALATTSASPPEPK